MGRVENISVYYMKNKGRVKLISEVNKRRVPLEFESDVRNYLSLFLTSAALLVKIGVKKYEETFLVSIYILVLQRCHQSHWKGVVTGVFPMQCLDIIFWAHCSSTCTLYFFLPCWLKILFHNFEQVFKTWHYVVRRSWLLLPGPRLKTRRLWKVWHDKLFSFFSFLQPKCENRLGDDDYLLFAS